MALYLRKCERRNSVLAARKSLSGLLAPQAPTTYVMARSFCASAGLRTRECAEPPVRKQSQKFSPDGAVPRVHENHRCLDGLGEFNFCSQGYDAGVGSGDAQGSRISVTQMAVCILAARSASTIKSRVIGTASRLIDSRI